MFIYTNQIALKSHLEPFLQEKKKIGFIPTMGALHQGHLSLMKKSLQQNHLTVVSIFVNPTQFNNPDDLDKYPRTLVTDVVKIKKLSQKIIIYSPSIEDVYGDNIVSEPFDFDGLEDRMEGRFRPGHFDGVGTIVKKLFEIVQPTRAYFGEKDYQQTLIVRKMVEKHNLPVKIVVCPIFREENGLAMSSRNERLTKVEREQAGVIYKTLVKAKTMFETKSHRKIYAYVEKVFKKYPSMELEYFVIAESQTLKPIVKRFKSKEYRAFIAVNVGNVRLIDTLSLT